VAVVTAMYVIGNKKISFSPKNLGSKMPENIDFLFVWKSRFRGKFLFPIMPKVWEYGRLGFGHQV